MRGMEQTLMLKVKYPRQLELLKAGLFLPSELYTNSDPQNPNGLAVGVYFCLCVDCDKITTRCSLCRIPIKDKGFRTSDGRWICPRDVPRVVLNEDDARELFESAREAAVDVVGNFFALKNSTVNVHVSDVFDITTSTDNLDTVAISKSTPTSTEIVHYVSVCTGLPKQETFYSCVHEYTHLWINENIHQHEIEHYTREGLCELVSYKVAEARGDAVAQKRILSNTYTKGVIADLVQYAREEDLPAVLNWVSNGTTRTLAEGAATAAALKMKPPEIPLDVQISLAQQAQQALLARPGHQTLALSGMIKTPKGTVVLITGGVILGKGESGLINLNGKQSHIRCVDILSNAAVVQLENSTNILTLKVSHQ